MECKLIILSLVIIILSMILSTVGKYQRQTLNLAKRKIGGGMDSDYIPFQVLIKTVVDGTDYRCGGSIYSRNPKAHYFTEIITAAHCFPKATSKMEVTVTAGIKEVHENSSIRQVSKACLVIIHPNYDEKDKNSYNDIALVKLRTPLKKIPKRIEALSIIPLKDTQLSNSAQISGWGYKFESETDVHRLQVATIEIQSCEKHNVSSKGLQRCGGGSHGPDACRGDSGGPMVCKSKDNRSQFLCGVVSYGTECKNPPPHEVGVYTNVTHYMIWIKRNENNNCKKQFCT